MASHSTGQVPTNKNQRPFGSALAAISAGHSLLLQTDLFRRRRERFVIAVLSAAMAKTFPLCVLCASSEAGGGYSSSLFRKNKSTSNATYFMLPLLRQKHPARP